MNAKMDRRKFLEAGFGVLAVSVTGCGKTEKPPLDDRFTYDVSAYMKTDPALLLYAETSQFPTGLHEPKCLAVDGDTILVGGDRALKTFDATGKLLKTRDLPGLPHAVTAGGLVAYKDRFAEVSYGERAHLTGIAKAGDEIVVADAGNREVLRCDSDGKVLSRIKGFAVPSPYFDLHAGADGLLWVVNPGKHRIEAYKPDGTLELSWGETGMNVEGFCGCCNPVYFTRLPDGRFVTSEKGLNRIKIYSATGKFLGVVAGPEHLVKDLELAKKACANCRIGFGFPIACDAAGRVLALDPATKQVRIFTAKKA
jgi:hypothetical protein